MTMENGFFEARECIEWTRTEWDNANSGSLPRVLLIGDSITNHYYPFARDLLKGKVYTDKYVTSKCTIDPFFMKELDLYISEYPYVCVHFNNGLHGFEGPAEPVQNYIEGYERLLQRVLLYCPNTILATSTPVSLPGELHTLKQEIHVKVLERNEAVKALAQRYGLAVNDLFSCVIDFPELHVDDGAHFKDEGSSRLAEQVCAAVGSFI